MTIPLNRPTLADRLTGRLVLSQVWNGTMNAEAMGYALALCGGNPAGTAEEARALSLAYLSSLEAAGHPDDAIFSAGCSAVTILLGGMAPTPNSEAPAADPSSGA